MEQWLHSIQSPLGVTDQELKVRPVVVAVFSSSHAQQCKTRRQIRAKLDLIRMWLISRRGVEICLADYK
jgi:hypothetical protein